MRRPADLRATPVLCYKERTRLRSRIPRRKGQPLCFHQDWVSNQLSVKKMRQPYPKKWWGEEATLLN